MGKTPYAAPDERAQRRLVDSYAADSFIMFPKAFLLHFDIQDAVMLSMLMDIRRQFRVECDKKKGWFFCTVKNLQRRSRLTTTTQWRIINRLEERNIIQCRVRGTPPKRYFKLNDSALIDLITNSISDQQENDDEWSSENGSE